MLPKKRIVTIPGGPYIKHPFGGVIPSVLNLSACFIGRTLTKSAIVSARTSSGSHCLHQFLNLLVQSTDVCVRLCRSLVHLHSLHSGVVFWIDVRWSVSMELPPTLASFRTGAIEGNTPAGSLSRIRYESLFTPIRSPGLSSLCGTRPMMGRNTV